MTLAPTSFIGCLRHGWDLTPWDCIEMQLHALRPWIGWPCNGCERPVTIEVPKRAGNYDGNYDKPLKTLSPEAIRRGRAAVKKLGKIRAFAPCLPLPPVSVSPKPRRTWPQGMSKAVARSLGLV